MEEKKNIIPDFGHIDFANGRPVGFPKPKVVRCGTKNRNYAPIKVKRSIRTGVRMYQPGEPIDWAKAYLESGVALLGMDILRLCNFSQWHEWSDEEHSVYFEMELIGEEAMLTI